MSNENKLHKLSDSVVESVDIYTRVRDFNLTVCKEEHRQLQVSFREEDATVAFCKKVVLSRWHRQVYTTDVETARLIIQCFHMLPDQLMQRMPLSDEEVNQLNADNLDTYLFNL